MEILSSIVGIIAESIPKILGPRAGYLFKYESKVENLRNQIEKLKGARERVQDDVTHEKMNGKEIFMDVDRWLTEANEKIADEFDKKLKADEEKAKTKCFVGLCSNFKSRYQLGKKAEKEANSIANLLRDVPKGVSKTRVPEGVGSRSVEGYQDFDSRSAALTEVLKALQNDDVNRIGVYGMGGVGKTTLVREVAYQAKKKLLFEEDAMATITQNFDTKKIQDELADALGLKFEKKSDSGRADELRHRLNESKRVLIILDDIWKELVLEEIGIPATTDHQGCKILMASRECDVLCKMHSQRDIYINILNEVEAWHLFQEMAGDVTEKPDIADIAQDVAKRCAGLPIALKTIGTALKNKNLPEWKNALRDLKRPSGSNFKGIPKEVYTNMELSYKFLESEELRLIFLLCSIMGHNASIEDLLKYSMGLGFLRRVNTIEEARNKVITLVGDLKDSCLLLNGSNTNFIYMHDVVHDVAIAIAERDRRWLVLGREDAFKGWSDQEEMETCNLISLQNCEVNDLFECELQCPNLTFFFIASENSLKFPDQFFKGMQCLKVLDFSKLCLSPLPSSIGCLTNIRSLCLSECLLEDVAMVGDLKSIEILNLQRSKITMLPEKIGQLTKLKSLDLSSCDNLNVITPGVLSRLSNLEELYLLHGFSQWEREGHEEPSCNARLAELKDLSKLTALEVEICDEYAIPQDLFSQKLERHKVLIRQGTRYQNYFIGQSSKFPPESLKVLVLCETTRVNTYEDVKKSLKKIDFLILDDVRSVKDLVYDLNTEGFSDLKHLEISGVAEIQYIINSDQHHSSEVFPILESLNLQNLCNLEKICNYGDQLREATFNRLRSISIFGCYKLKNLFPYSIAKRLTRLEEIDIRGCNNMIELFAGVEDEGQSEGISERDDEEERTLVFPKLESLELCELYNFTTLCSCSRYNISIQFSSLTTLTIEEIRIVSIEDHRNQPLFDEKITFPKLQQLFVEDLLGMASSIATCSSEAFQNLTKLSVSKCNSLKNVFSLSFLKSQCFEQLRELNIRRCERLEEVIVVVEGTSGRDIDEEKRTLVFPKLESLRLSKLPNLTAFCRCCSESNSISIQFPSLKLLTIWECSVLQTFVSTSASGAIEGTSNNSLQPLFNEKIAFPNLKQLKVDGCDKLKYMFSSSVIKPQCFEQRREEEISETDDDKKRTLMVLPKLESLTLSDLPNLVALCCCSESNISIEFSSLRYLEISHCYDFQTFVSTSTSRAIEATRNSSMEDHCIQSLFDEKTSFPKLEKLALHLDSSMKEMWHEQFPAWLYFSYTAYSMKKLELCGRIVELSAISSSQLSQALSPFPALEGLGISDSDLEEIFQNGNASTSHGDDKVIRSLKLSYLPEMMHLWKDKYSFQNLTTLKVNHCDNVWSLVPLPNLVSLEVEGCCGIIKLMTASTAKSLVKLTEMKISYCFNIKEIVECGDEEEQVKDEISFPSLTQLELLHLDKLECFSSSTNHVFRFPSLECLEKDIRSHWLNRTSRGGFTGIGFGITIEIPSRSGRSFGTSSDPVDLELTQLRLGRGSWNDYDDEKKRKTEGEPDKQKNQVIGIKEDPPESSQNMTADLLRGFGNEICHSAAGGSGTSSDPVDLELRLGLANS